MDWWQGVGVTSRLLWVVQGGGVAPIVYVPLFLLSAYSCSWCGIGG